MKTAETSPTEPSRGSSASLALRATGHWFSRRPSLVFLIIWLAFDISLNTRYPGSEPKLWYLVPSPDVIVIFFGFALCGRLNWELPRPARGVLVAWFFLVRFVRFGDGLQGRYYNQPFNLYTDLPLVPELIRFAHSTLKWWQFTPVAVTVLALLLGFWFAFYRALRFAEHYLREPKNVQFFAALAGAAFLFTWLNGHPPRDDELYRGGFAVSAIPRLRHEIDFLRSAYSKEAGQAQLIARTEARLSSGATDLGKLAGKNVHLILIESYGQTILERAVFVDAMRQTFDGFESELSVRGFSIVSNVLDSPTYGGHSWLAHATLATGVRTADQLDYEVVCAKKPKAIAKFFHDAGYRTVVAQPGTTRPWPKGEFFGFEQKYYLWNFGYVGPKYAWATMPDQYVLDFIRRHELREAKRPLFIQYVLVTSHAPWSDLPPWVDDWSRLGNGDIYNHLPTKHYEVVWPDFANASEAYVDSIKYDFQVLQRYLSDYVNDDSLVIILGDHQPVAGVNDHSASYGVPIHVLSRSAALLQPFIVRGYSAGMRPRRSGVRPGLESFLPDFLADFSGAPGSPITGREPVRSP